jgi:hypothetical protein
MEISKKQLALYTICLLTVAGGLTMVIAPPPEEIPKLWERFWKVEEPVSIDDNGASLTVDGTVSLATGTTLIPGKVVAQKKVIDDGYGLLIDDVDVDGYKKVYLTVYYTTGEPVQVDTYWYHESGGGDFYVIDLGETSSGGYVATYELDVRSPQLNILIWNNLSSGSGNPTDVSVYLYISPV